MWTNYLDKIFLINLKKREDRLIQATEQLNHYCIPFERVEAIEHENGAEGLKLTMEGIFKEALRKNWKNILIFEDDLDVIENTINEVMEEIVADIPTNYDIIYLGCQICNLPSGFYSPVLLKGIQNAYATHAAIYSFKGIKKIMWGKFFSPVDNSFAQGIQQEGNCFASYPILVSQIINKSDIYNDIPEMDWTEYLQGRYWQQIHNLRISNMMHPQAKTYFH